MQVATIGLDLAKCVFQKHGVDPCGRVVVRRKLLRFEIVAFFAALPPWVVWS
jgi:transposase